MNKQTKTKSFVESILNVSIGMIVNFLAQIISFPFFGINVTVQTNIKILALFTVLAIIRTFIVRRIFEKGMI